MPYHIGTKGSHDCSGYPVVKDSDGTVMGCHKTEEHAKKQLAALYVNEKIEKAEGFSPPQEVKSNAKRGLELREKHGRGGTEIGVARARDLSNGRSIPLATIRRMVSYFARHEVDKKGEGWGKDSAGYIAWLLWGGDAGKSWANRINNESKKKDKTMTIDFTNSYASIVKYDKNDDGTLMVFGKATDDTLDLDSQICDPTWLDTAMPAWFKSGGNIREMHGPSAAGVAKEYESKADGHYIGVHIVDPIAVKKVEARVYQGFSIGIKSPRVVRDTKAANGRIIDGQIVEVSLVDRPANPSAKLILAKAVEGESTLIQVEEAREYKAPLPSEILKKEPDYAGMHEGGDKSEPADTELYSRVKAEAKRKFSVYPSAVANAWVVNEYKKRGGTYKKKTNKNDKTMKGTKMETTEQIMELVKSLTTNQILELVKNLTEKADMPDCANGDCKECSTCMAAEKESAEVESAEGPAGSGAEHELAEEKSDDCPDCTDDKMCDKCAELAADMEKSAESHKCLECGCGLPAETHGRNDVTTAEMVLEDGAPKSADAEEVPEISEDKTSDVTALEEAVEKAVKSAMEKLQAEMETVRAEKESAVEKSVKLETELATALTKTVAGGPKRTATKMSTEAQNDMLVKAATYKAKADASTDPLLAKGYREIANDFIAKANPKSDK